MMVSVIEIRADDALIQQLDFKTYRYTTKRQAQQFTPDADQPQTVDVKTPWGGTLTGKRGDYLVNEYENPDDRWVVEKEIFEATYQEDASGVYRKKAAVDLVPLTQVTHDPDQEVIVYSTEGPVTARAGDFFLARGVNGELWPMPKNKVESSLEPVK